MKLSVILFFLFIFSGNTECKTSTEIINDNTIEVNKPYHIQLELEKTSRKGIYNLLVKMTLEEGSYYVSPNSKRDFKGKFNLRIDPNNKLMADNFLLEVPASVEEHDPHPFVNGKVNWVRTNTVYMQQLSANPEDEFVATGLIQFVIEPQCTLEKIPFTISQKNGIMQVRSGGC